MQSQMKGHTHGKNGVCICDLGGIFAAALSLYLCEYSSMEVWPFNSKSVEIFYRQFVEGLDCSF